MFYPIRNYHKANEVLYALAAVEESGGGAVSKIALQKLLYLASALAPIKEVVLEFLHFIYQKRGPYSKDIQNAVDHLVALGLVEVVSFKRQGRAAFANYRITPGGQEAVAELKKYVVEEEKYWWIGLVTRLAVTFTQTEPDLSKASEYDGLDVIVDLVYQDPTFKAAKERKGRLARIDFSESEGPTIELISFLKQYAEDQNLVVDKENERRNAELLVYAFFEYLYVNSTSEV